MKKKMRIKMKKMINNLYQRLDVMQQQSIDYQTQINDLQNRLDQRLIQYFNHEDNVLIGPKTGALAP